MSFVNTTSTADSNLIENNFIKKAGVGFIFLVGQPMQKQKTI